MVKLTNFDHLTTVILEFWPWSWSKMAIFDHLTTAILKFWPWSWSKIFDHLTMTPGRRPNGQKIVVILPPPPLTTLAERRLRGDLIETFKIVNGLVDYGENIFRLSRSGSNIVNKCHFGEDARVKRLNSSFISERVKSFWNHLPVSVKNSANVDIIIIIIWPPVPVYRSCSSPSERNVRWVRG